MTDGFLDVGEEFLAGGLKFEADEVIKFKCCSVEENKMYDLVKLKCEVLTGKHEGKLTDVVIRSKPAHHKRQFILAFWSQDEIIQKQARLCELANKVFEAKCEVSEYEGKTYQNWRQFKKVVATLDDVNE